MKALLPAGVYLKMEGSPISWFIGRFVFDDGNVRISSFLVGFLFVQYGVNVGKIK